MNVDSATTALSASATGAATTSKASFSADFETFLTLLTTQLTQQDPLSPMDSDKFTQQLVQYSQVEQSIKTNSNLERMLNNMEADQLTGALNYVGKWVEIEGDTVQLDDTDDASLTYTLPDNAVSASAAIIDEDGATIIRLDAPAGGGTNTFTWDGIGVNGQRQAPGNYRIAIEALDSEGGPLEAVTRVGGLVEGVERSGTSIALIVGGNAHGLQSVRSVTTHQVN